VGGARGGQLPPPPCAIPLDLQLPPAGKILMVPLDLATFFMHTKTE